MTNMTNKNLKKLANQISTPKNFLTKLMVLSYIFNDESKYDLNDFVMASDELDLVKKKTKNFGIKKGQIFFVKDLVKLALMQNYSDATYVLMKYFMMKNRRKSSYYVHPKSLNRQFCKKINSYYKKLGVYEFNIADPDGARNSTWIDSKEVQKVKEIAFQNEMIKEISKTSETTIVDRIKIVNDYMQIPENKFLEAAYDFNSNGASSVITETGIIILGNDDQESQEKKIG